jgi:hypothetical protein
VASYPTSTNSLATNAAPATPVPPSATTSTVATIRPRTNAFDSFERYDYVNRIPLVEQAHLLQQLAKKPSDFWALKQKLSVGLKLKTAPQSFQPNSIPAETLNERMQIFLSIKSGLDTSSQRKLDVLLNRGVLTNVSSDNGHSTLYHLYQRLHTPVANGFNAHQLVTEYIDFLSTPYQVTQKPAPVLADTVKHMQEADISALSEFRPLVYQPHKHTEKEIQINKTFNCPAAAIMYGMGDQQPSELLRQLNGLTSPARSFTKNISLNELSPDNPAEAMQYFVKNGLRYIPISATQGQLQIEAPYAVYQRAVSDAHNPNKPQGTRNAIQTLYQMTLVDLPDRMAYDEVNDLMYNPDGSLAGEGLPGDQIDVLSTIIEGGGGTQSVTTQAFGPNPNPQNERESSLPYLFGYKLPFSQIEAALIEALNQGKQPMLGITYTDPDGGMPGGHYFRISGARMKTTPEKPNGQLFFTIVDSDDGDPNPVDWSAAELIPMINRMHLPTNIGKRLNDQIKSQPETMLLTPDAEDAKNYHLANICKTGVTPIAPSSTPTPNA